MRTHIWRALLAIILILFAFGAWYGHDDEKHDDKGTLRILSGSENESLEPLIQEFAAREGLNIEFTYGGSVDIMLELGKGVNSTYDAVWPANRMWIVLGDSTGAIQNSASIMRSPVVFGVKKSVANRLGWIGSDVKVDDILNAAESGKLRFMMTNATQSDSGASAYIGFLYAFAGHPDVLTDDVLDSPNLQEIMKRFLGTVDRSAGSSGFLKDLFLREYDSYDAMINYESTIIETNQALVKEGKEPLYIVYPEDGTAIADSPLAFIDKDRPNVAAIFNQLQNYLLSDDVQRQLLGMGRRAGLGINPDPASIDQAVFNPDWGVDTQRILTPIRIPNAEVVRKALNLYQTTFRKPSFTVYLLDYSASMQGNNGEKEVKAAMRILLDQESSANYFLQASPDDITVVIAFNDDVRSVWTVKGNDPAQLLGLTAEIEQTNASGGTAIYSAVVRGLEVINELGVGDSFPAIVLLTDGHSNRGKSFDDVKAYIENTGMPMVPIYGITFGSASRSQLEQLAEFSSGAVFDGRTDLAGAFRVVRGYN